MNTKTYSDYRHLSIELIKFQDLLTRLHVEMSDLEFAAALNERHETLFNLLVATVANAAMAGCHDLEHRQSEWSRFIDQYTKEFRPVAGDMLCEPYDHLIDARNNIIDRCIHIQLRQQINHETHKQS